MKMPNCQYGECEKEASAKGTVLAFNKEEPSKDICVEVYACDKHKKVSSFFEDKQVNAHSN